MSERYFDDFAVGDKFSTGSATVTIHVEGEVVDKRPSSSKPDRGTARIAYRYLNQKGEVVPTCTAIHLLRRRPAAR